LSIFLVTRATGCALVNTVANIVWDNKLTSKASMATNTKLLIRRAFLINSPPSFQARTCAERSLGAAHSIARYRDSNFSDLEQRGRKLRSPHFKDLKPALIRNQRGRKVKSAAGFAASELYTKTGTTTKKN
jgi:hypothetical protein